MDRVMKDTRRQCFLAMRSSIVVVVCVCIGVTMNLVTVYDENFDHMGIRTFCMFTVNSNILMAVTMCMAIPYTVDGLRRHDFHLPRWAAVAVYAGVTAVMLTFVIPLFVLAPFKGFVLIFSGSRFFLHGVCPVLAFISFCFFMSEQRLKFVDMLITLIPVLIYAVLYYVMVVVVGEENGGWNDFYGFATKIPVWISMALVMPLTFALSSIIRLFHNRTYDRRRAEEAEFFKATLPGADIRKLVTELAHARASEERLRNIVIPTRVISIMLGYKTEPGLELDEASHIYLKEYLEHSRALKMENLWI